MVEASPRAAVQALLEAVLRHLSDLEEAPRIGRMADHRRWWRYGQETFVGLQPRAWDMPDYVPIHGWLDKTFPEMTGVRDAYAADTRLGPRVDAMIGTEFNRQARTFDWLLIEHLLQPLVLATGSYEFDADAFASAYRSFEDGFGADELHMVEFLPLNGFDSTEDMVALPDRVTLRRMSDAQMSNAIDQLAAPRQWGGGGGNSVRVSRYDQWALVTSQAYLVAVGPGDDAQPPKAAAFPTLFEPGTRLVTALRIVCGGSVVATRPMFAQDDSEFPLVLNTQTMGNSFDSADYDRPTILVTDAVDHVQAMYLALGRPEVAGDRSLQTAIRRLVASGSRRVDADRLIDLSIAAEALFIHHANQPSTFAKGEPIARGAVALLADDPEVGVDAEKLRAFMTTLYRARNAEIHGDATYPQLHDLSGTPIESLGPVLRDADRVMRRALALVLVEAEAVAGT